MLEVVGIRAKHKKGPVSSLAISIRLKAAAALAIVHTGSVPFR